VDHAGNVVSVGEEGTSDARASQVQVAKYTPDGELLWRRAFGGGIMNCLGRFAIDAADDIILVGSDADPEVSGRYPLIAKLSASGELLWTQLARMDRDAKQAFGVAVDASGNAVMVMDTGDVAKYSPSGERLWAEPAETKTRGTDIVVDAAGASFVLRGHEAESFLSKISANARCCGNEAWVNAGCST
jgi:outer membrane protein assembly factor BamB